MKRRALLLLLALPAGGCAPPAAAPSPPRPIGVRAREEPPEAPIERPRLVVWLTVDQLRGDSFSRFAHLISAEGFGHLLEVGTHFTAATYAHAISETAPGHATLFTGASPREHGIVANEWLTEAGQLVASVTDTASPLLGPELDPAETTPTFGRSPQALRLPTLGDALRQTSAGRSHVVAVSLKDRGAILPAGRSGRAFWLGKRGFVTSRYYANEVPALLTEHHQAHPLASYLVGDWPLSLAESAYVSKLERPLVGARIESFPHRPKPDASAAAWLKSTPAGDVAVIDLAEHLCRSLALGKGDVVDLLSVSLSANDYVGHLYGPESREAEDTFARLDGVLAGFFSFLESQVSRERILYVLSADHGIAESPEALTAAGLAASRMTEEDIEAAARRAMRRAFGNDRWLLGVAPPGIYLNAAAIEQSGHELAPVRARLAEELSREPGIFRAFAAGAPADGSEVGKLVLESIFEERSGDVYVVTLPHVQIVKPDEAAGHGSPWFLDRHVPIVLSGPGVPRGTVGRAVDVRALAGSVAELAGVPPPAGAHSARLLSANSGSAPGD